MSDLAIYLIKVSAGLGIIFVPYYFLFRDDPNLVLKRFYLLGGLLAAWFFPLITFSRPDMFVNLTPTVFIDPGASDPQVMNKVYSGTSSGITINWIQVLLITYLAGMLSMLFKTLFIIIKWNLTWHKTKNDEGVALIKNNQVFTIFTRIFIPGSLTDKEDLDNILLHEKAHIRQLHFIDLMVMELTLLLTWFNPFSWLISRMIKENHEHLADRQVLSAGVNPARYRAQLLNHTLGVNVFRLGNQFNHSLTLKRFNMMKKPKKSPLGFIKILLLGSAVLITLGLTTSMKPLPKTIMGHVILADSGDPAIGASVIIQGTTQGTVCDTEGTFQLNVDGDPDIVISFVGYSNLRIKASRVAKAPLKLEPKVFELDLESVPGSEPKDDVGELSFRGSDGTDKHPVFVVDGKVVKEIENIDPETIEKVEVFKDPGSEIAKKYNAQDGVVVITTKKGKALLDETGSSNKGDTVLFYIVEDMPSYPGGTEALKSYIDANLKYPETVKEKGISGEVFVQFAVMGTGKIEEVKVVRSTYEGFDQAAMDVFKGMTDWNPGKQRGKPVKVQVVVPVRFNADKE